MSSQNIVQKDMNKFKVKNILEDSLLDSILTPSHSVKIQIIGGKVGLRCKGKTLLGVVNKLFCTKSLLTVPSNVWPKQNTTDQMFLTPWRLWNRIQATLKIFSILSEKKKFRKYIYFFSFSKKLKGVSSKPSGNLIVALIFCF